MPFQSLYRHLFDTMLQGVVYQDANGTIIAMNSAAERILGKTKDEFLGQTLVSVEQDALREDGSPFPGLEHPAMVALRTGREVRDVVMQIYNPREQQYRWISITAVPLKRSVEGAPCEVYTIFDDITERKQAEKALRENQRALETARDELEARVKDRTAKLLQTNERLRGEVEEHARTEQSLRLEEARLDALLRLSKISDASVSEIASFVLEQGIALTQSKIGFVGFLNEEESIYTLHAVSKDVVKECSVTGDPMQWHIAGAGVWADAIRERKTLFINDYSKPHPRKKGFPPGHPHIQKFMVVPILEGERVVAVAGVGNKASDYDASDERQIALLLGGMWNRVQQNEAAEALQRAHDELEERVKQRTAELAELNVALRGEIAERKQAEEELRQNREWLRVTLTSIGDGVIATDVEGRITFLNPVAAALTGWEQDQAWGQPIHSVFDTINLQTREPAEDIVGRVLEEERAIMMANNTALVTREGREIPIEDSAAPILDAAGNVMGVVLVFHDVTEKRRAQQALRESEERFRSVLDNSLDAAYRRNLQTDRYDYLSPAFEKMTGWTVEEMKSTDSNQVLARIHPDDVALVQQEIERTSAACQAGEPATATLEYRFMGKDGTYRWLGDYVNVLPDSEGQPLYRLGIKRDITGRKQREREIQRLNRTLRAQSHSDRALMQATSEAEYMQEVCRIIIEDCGHAMVWIGFAEDDEYKSVRPVAYAGFEEGYLETLGITWADTERGRGPTGTAVRTGKPSFCRNMLTDPKFTPWRKEALARGYASSLVLPVMEDGHAFGALTIYFREPDPFTDSEIALLSGLADDLSYGIRMIRLREAHARAEQALRESEERYRHLFNAMTEGFAHHEIVLNAEGKPSDYRFLDINPGFEKLTGLKREDVVGRTVLEVLPDTEPFWIETYGRVALTGEPVHFEQHSGALGRDYEVFGFRPAANQFAALFLDVTERKRAEEAIHQAKEEWESTFDSVPDLIAILDDQFRIVRANRAMAQRLSLEPEQCVGNICYECVHALSGPPEFCPHIRTLADGREHIAEVHEEHLGGDFLVSTTPLLDPRGQRIGSVHVARDITERKEAEVALQCARNELEQRVKERTAELQASEERFRQLAETIHEAFWMLDPTARRLLYVSPAYDAIWGRSREGLYERPESFLKTVHPDDRQTVLGGLTSDWLAYDGEFRILRPDGTPRNIRLRSFPILDEAGKAYRVAGVATDVTDQKAAEAALIQAERVTIASKMAAAMVHEINNPLQSVIGCLGLAEEAAENNEDPSRYLQIVHQELRRTVGIVGQLRALGRPAQNARKEPTDLNDLLSDVLTLNKKDLETKKIEVTWEPDAGMQPVAVMPDPLRQVFLNLVLNAMDAMPEGGQLRVRTERGESPDGVRVVVADSGIGIAPDVLPRIFEPFYTTKSSGMGVGLFVCQSIIEQHDGRIDVESQPGVGTTFTVWLPSGE